MTFKEKLLKSWQHPTLLTVFLMPLSYLYRVLFWLRACAYKAGLLKQYRAPMPVIVVGNITVGGTGKTPMVIYLVELLRAKGYQPGVISRGYSGNAQSYPLTVLPTTAVEQSGDEPALIVQRTAAPMVIGSNRAAAIKQLIAEFDVNVIISDDGLQHLALHRDIEICLQDLTSTGTNFNLLPAGPYRETSSRLETVDMVVHHVNKTDAKPDEITYSMTLEASQPQAVSPSNDGQWQSPKLVHAVAGIGNPGRFFKTCQALGLNIIEHAFDDHHQFSATDIEFDDSLPVLMTHKDAVKCSDIANQPHWYLPVSAKLDASFDAQLLNKLENHISGASRVQNNTE